MSEVIITWVGHATVLIEADGKRILTDPVLRDRVGPIRRYAAPIRREWTQGLDAVLISHLHFDHLDLPSLRALDRNTPVVAPRGGGGLIRRLGFANVLEVDVDSRWSLGPLQLQAVPADHSGLRPPFGPTAPALGYLIEGSLRVYFPGDTGFFPEMAHFTNIDAALLPVGGWGPTLRGRHLDPVTAATAAAIMRPRWVVPIHWGTMWPIGCRQIRHSRFSQPGHQFARVCTDIAPNVGVRVLQPGDTVSLSHLQSISWENS